MITIKKNTPYYAICYNGKFNIYFVVKRKGYVAKSDNSDIGLAFDTKTRDITEISTGKLVPRSVVDSILGKERWTIKDIEFFTEQFINRYGDLIKKSRLGEYSRLVKQAEAKNVNIYGEYKTKKCLHAFTERILENTSVVIKLITYQIKTAKLILCMIKTL